MSNIKLSILCITYNHEKFIRDTLDGFISQETNFQFEVLIHDDASTDNTANIIREYEKKYPNIIKPVYQTQNQYSKGISVSKAFNFPRIQGEYVAMCEGDDYWIDKYKLQKQVDFLDSNLDYTVCFHPVKVIFEDNSWEPSVFPSKKHRFNKLTLELPDLLKHNFIQTNSVVYRWVLKGNEQLFPDGISPGDWFLHLLHAQQGKIYCLQEVMSVYRRHENGIWWESGKTDKFFIQQGCRCIAFYQSMEKQFNCNKQSEIDQMVTETIFAYLNNSDFENLQKFAQIYPLLYMRFIKKEYQTVNNYANKYKHKYKKYRIMNACAIFVILVLLVFLVK